jgi:hypothetical protein
MRTSDFMFAVPRRAGPVHRAARAALLSLGVAASCAALGQATGPSPIYSCVDASGKRLTSDRPIAECTSREQRVLNADGSVKKVLPPTPTADEHTEIEARQRDAAIALATKQEAIRRDRNLIARFPNEAAHRKARLAALDDVRKSVRVSEERLALLAAERKPLTDEAEFYVGKPLPAKLKTQLDANDASVEAQRVLVQNQRLEEVRIDKLYDAELERLKKLWAGAQPGSMGTLAGVAASAPPRK